MFRLLVLICFLQLWSCQKTTEKYVVASFGKVNWFQAHQICHRSDMILATVTSYEQHVQVIRSIALNGHLLGYEGFWLGASNLADLKSWTWLGLGIPLGYKRWASDEPQSDLIGKEGCMVLGLDTSWYSVDCRSEYYFICERQCNSTKSLEPLYI
ncbi:uncharacterized protein Dvir_GJ20885 [Drosophila virilis]|uniref:C-type lectin domain-containing protein n=1 Tax=Drosophila virilis TaxID=7244 RepID=B4LIL6_DROVI|nr:C-type lectin domain family 17, member A [Drosophila virilis]EDW60386.1 uncharacterized protein Dvir_GJ20885 [Drosophila virilis]